MTIRRRGRTESQPQERQIPLTTLDTAVRASAPTGADLADIANTFGTPVWVYDAHSIRARVEQLQRFDVIRFAQKACSNVHILRLMRELGIQVDAVSAGELERALVAGYAVGNGLDEIVFTADLLDRPTLSRVLELGIPVNAGSPQMLEMVGAVSPQHPVWIRVNPGFGHGHSRKTNTGGEHSKHGIWHENLSESLHLIDHYDLDLVGLHMHIGSGVDYSHLSRVCDAMVTQVTSLGRDIWAISAGGGLSVPYVHGEPEINIDEYFRLWDSARREIENHIGHSIRLEIEPGRFLVANSGSLIAEVRAHKDVGSHHFVLVDAGFNDLMRPAMYGSHHGVSAISSSGEELTDNPAPSILAGPLCESGDVFSQDSNGDVTSIPLPRVAVGDYVVFHDTGAYGASMSSNYNSRPLAPEVLVDKGTVTQIRRRQTIDELLALEL
ncbi:diaminopimelate decarboxylase [Rathayibacter toxicus]|uniref:diaminopimelate decarboxylase n=1 Tax=Rathayibacter toxicus TaxID=145458 RepID=UPI001C050624|nr:diaminopimelate decarboxylase [Rathayibacter toxicus]QWL32468.1 diaminopimelate decarboxylase [Rathayibacter toxicus]QWL34562.1 diaminopimelate decarboxylase [Rathayibacter toxicus]QWL36694.1 diaminopimelate decarboxylase [Rathayibacter toxicus]QWL38783.1 diaminopimelate decarboxylase [Rathayibacter toxicus]QWL40871.1 diaminopimelate decarboxylase [Rathayibacter toxicus]